ncbi:polymer-forming cytoskeletal protein [uncultured Oscillibacter sp.]|jgi:cytoskeletal protein CcmA (bactofilin family)|uniref:bactofilin family protein n=1 Tax=uncultured Oscillibacter sp. TaxID=876091 RepID=UPI00216BC61E|nr:polymer-forming cytoskeletal protein [uncultured Oscillibacter sp.]MCI9554082.1 polymer-forming cytoskeletal protein [Oscillibacter sp.]
MAFFGGQPKSTPAMESQTDGGQREGADIPELPEPRSNTVVAKDILLTGKLSGEGVVQIEGTVEGEVNLKGYVIVTPTGKVKGPVEADVIRVAGQVEGNLISHDHVQLERTGTINGDVTTVSFVIENGGRLNGRTTMVPEQASTPHVENLEPLRSEEQDEADS